MRCVHWGTRSSGMQPSHMTTCQPVMPWPPGTAAGLAEQVFVWCGDMWCADMRDHYFGILRKKNMEMWICMCMHLFSVLIIESAELCPLAGWNNFFVPEFKPHQTLHISLLFSIKINIMHLIADLSWIPCRSCLLQFFTLFLSVSLGVSVVHLSMLIRKGLSPQSLFISGMDGWMDRGMEEGWG